MRPSVLLVLRPITDPDTPAFQQACARAQRAQAGRLVTFAWSRSC